MYASNGNSAPGVGLGLALCRRLARDLGGRLAMEKPNGDGASLVLTLPLVDSDLRRLAADGTSA